MSVLIKGMEMPTQCYDCYLIAADPDKDGLYCKHLKKDVNDWSSRLEDCPLVEVPTPHGRLVDADGIVRYANCEITGAFAYPQGTRQDDEKRYRESWDFVRTVVIATPTVIEREE